MTDQERLQLIEELAWRSGWNKQAFDRMTDKELIQFQERLNE
ncbi:hypothetical protein [Sediminibacillus halophilus]|uniref:Uncharacterized protein n=1 Tax=Sediminibacillus halophilus TaxID=482461 RepID=A0A1G9QVT2_9BACI|nr:hypothetical protein [Sediminibacillus halophilus]SDM15126.1 hypothetical protein SAMN05216244_1692 [Sediminibacillus halophilus]